MLGVDNTKIEIELTDEQQRRVYSLTGAKAPCVVMSSLQFGAFRLAAMAVGSNALPVSSSTATIKRMLTKKPIGSDGAGPLTIELELTTEQKAQIGQVTHQIPDSLILAPDEWKMVFHEKWKAAPDLLRLGRSIVIVPRGMVYEPSREECVITMPTVKESAQNVFGTGTHATTQLALIFLEGCLKKGDRVLDLGTGSGLLAVVAAKLGAREVLALDIEPNAVSIARGMVAENSQGKLVRVAQGGLEAAEGSYDVIVANIFTNVIISMASDLYSALRPSGSLITSGIIHARADEVSATLCGVGFQLQGRRLLDGWEGLAFRRPNC